MTQSNNPNVTTNAEGETIVLEPGDPGYIEPGTELADTPPSDPTAVAPDKDPREQTELLPVPPGEDLTHQRNQGESDAEFMARTRNVAVVSENPTDIVPNTPQITMGVQVPVEGAEGLVTGVPPEALTPAEEEDVVAAEADRASTSEPRASAADLIAQAQAATTTEELDRIEAQADGRSTVLSAVAERRASLP